MGWRLLWLLMLIYSHAALARVTETWDFQTYPVQTDGVSSLLAAVKAASPIRVDGKTFLGLTTTKVEWKLRFSTERTGLCRVSDALVVLNGAILLPMQVGTDTTQRVAFDRFVNKMRMHEMGHANHWKMAIRAIDAFVLKLPAMSSCAKLDSLAKDGAKRILEKYGEIDKQYDNDTEHGVKQGVLLPS